MPAFARSRRVCTSPSTAGEINPEDPDAREIPNGHVGTSAQEVKMWVGLGLGYERVVWNALPEAVRMR
jgi:hypothetical protein